MATISTNWTKGTTKSTIWAPQNTPAGFILLQSSDNLLLQDGSSKGQLQ